VVWEDGDGAAGFHHALESFLRAQRRKGRAEGTLVSYRRYLGRLGRFLSQRGISPLAVVTAQEVLAFWDEQLARESSRPSGGPLSSGTLNVAAASIRAFFAHLLDEGLVLVDPSRDLERPRCPKKLPRKIPTPRQMRQLVLAPDPSKRMGVRNRAILELMYGTGLRASELCGLRLSDVDVVGRQVFVAKGKGGRQRLVPMGRKAAQALEAYLAKRGASRSTASSDPEKGEPLFLRQDGGPIRPPALRYILKKSRATARVPFGTPHTLRHACATHLLKGGAGIRQIQALLGHASIESTEIYTKVETSDLRVMLDKHHPRSRASGGAG
jgi:site-specific recombinase XerD